MAGFSKGGSSSATALLVTGADPTNTNDSTTAIQAQLTAAGTIAAAQSGLSTDVFLPPGHYAIKSGPLVIPSGVRLFTSGMPAPFPSQIGSSPCILDATNTPANATLGTPAGCAVCLGNPQATTPCIGPRIENIAILNQNGYPGTGGTVNAFGVGYFGTNNGRVINCMIAGFRYGAYWQGLVNNTAVGCNNDTFQNCRIGMPLLPSSGGVAANYGLWIGCTLASGSDAWNILIQDCMVTPDNRGTGTSTTNQVCIYHGNEDGTRTEHLDFDVFANQSPLPRNCVFSQYDFGNGVSSQRPTGTVMFDVDPRCTSVGSLCQVLGSPTTGNNGPDNLITRIRPQNSTFSQGDAASNWNQSFSGGTLARILPGVRIDAKAIGWKPKVATPGGASPIANWVSGTGIANPYPFPVLVLMSVTISTASTFTLQLGGPGNQNTIFSQSAVGTYSLQFILSPMNEASSALGGDPPYTVGGTLLTPTFTSGDATVTWNWEPWE